jgi:hypothetical protein
LSYTPIKAKGGESRDFEKVPAGTHFAICQKVVYLGIQTKTYPDGVKELPEVYLGFEIPDIQIEYTKGGKQVKGPATIGRTFTLNIGAKSNLGPFLTNWRGASFTQAQQDEGFDVNSLLGKVCNLGVIHTEDGKYVNISSAGSLMKIQKEAIEAGTLSVAPHNALVQFNADEPDPSVYDKLPKFLKAKIDSRVTTKKNGKPLDRAPGADDEFDDDIPF